MDQEQHNSNITVISLLRERFEDQYVFCRVDDVDRKYTYKVVTWIRHAYMLKTKNIAKMP